MSLFEHFSSGENLYSKIVSPVCEKYGLTYMEFTVLMFLHNNPQYDTATQIVKIRRLSKSHVSISVRSLQQRGLLSCCYLHDDHRTIHLSLTPAAAPITADGVKVQKIFSDILYTGFSEEEMQQLSQLIGRIDQNIEFHTNQLIKKQEAVPHAKQ